jgi:hypothetical protein
MKLCDPEIKVDGTDKVLWPLSYTNLTVGSGIRTRDNPINSGSKSRLRTWMG